MYTSSQHVPERNQDATIYVGNLTANVSEELLWELFLQSGPVVNVHIPKDKVTNVHQVIALVAGSVSLNISFVFSSLNFGELPRQLCRGSDLLNFELKKMQSMPSKS
jgi:splicing factor 3B subunit 4